MEGLLKAFWPLNATSPSTVLPTYRQGDYEDSIDLQIKSLLYMFRRSDIAESQAFLNDAAVGGVGVAGAGGSDRHREQAKLQRDSVYQGLQGSRGLPGAGVRSKLSTLDKKYSLGDLKANSPGRSFTKPPSSNPKPTSASLPGVSPMDKEKLDVLYSKTEFDKVMKNDKHRVLIDWKKNKFRSLCLLSGKPAQGSVLPKFPVKNYSFSVLQAKSSEVTYITTLSGSNLYIEHYVSKETRQRLAKEALDLVKKVTPSTSDFSKKDRAMVILTYLRRLSVEVQVDRLYKNLYRERIKVENRPKNPLSIPEQKVAKITAKTSVLMSTPKKALTLSPHLSTLSTTPSPPKYYMKAKGDTNIPFSHRATSAQKPSQPILAFVNSPQQIQTTKPRAPSSPRDSLLSPSRSRSNSPVRSMSRATNSSYSSLSSGGSPGQPQIRKKTSSINLATTSGPLLSSPSRSVSVCGPSKSLTVTTNPRTPQRKLSGTPGQIPRTISRLGGPSPSAVGSKVISVPENNNDQIRQEVMAQTRKAVQDRLEREQLLIKSEQSK